MLLELTEQEATGDLAQIYHDIRTLCAVPAIFAALPGTSDVPMPPSEQFSEVMAALDRYRETSPQMVVFGTLIRDALPT